MPVRQFGGRLVIVPDVGLSQGPTSESSEPDDRPILATALALYCARARRKISGIAPSMRLWPAVRVLSAAVGQRCA